MLWAPKWLVDSDEANACSRVWNEYPRSQATAQTWDVVLDMYHSRYGALQYCLTFVESGTNYALDPGEVYEENLGPSDPVRFVGYPIEGTIVVVLPSTAAYRAGTRNACKDATEADNTFGPLFSHVGATKLNGITSLAVGKLQNGGESFGSVSDWLTSKIVQLDERNVWTTFGYDLPSWVGVRMCFGTYSKYAVETLLNVIPLDPTYATDAGLFAMHLYRGLATALETDLLDMTNTQDIDDVVYAGMQNAVSTYGDSAVQSRMTSSGSAIADQIATICYNDYNDALLAGRRLQSTEAPRAHNATRSRRLFRARERSPPPPPTFKIADGMKRLVELLTARPITPHAGRRLSTTGFTPAEVMCIKGLNDGGPVEYNADHPGADGSGPGDVHYISTARCWCETAAWQDWPIKCAWGQCSASGPCRTYGIADNNAGTLGDPNGAIQATANGCADDQWHRTQDITSKAECEETSARQSSENTGYDIAAYSAVDENSGDPIYEDWAQFNLQSTIYHYEFETASSTDALYSNGGRCYADPATQKTRWTDAAKPVGYHFVCRADSTHPTAGYVAGVTRFQNPSPPPSIPSPSPPPPSPPPPEPPSPSPPPPTPPAPSPPPPTPPPPTPPAPSPPPPTPPPPHPPLPKPPPRPPPSPPEPRPPPPPSPPPAPPMTCMVPSNT
jgi:hypothetical protein